MIPLVASTSDAAGIGELFVGLPVAAVIVALAFMAWRLLDTGRIVLGREHRALREDRNFWRSVALRALNIGEAAIGRSREHAREQDEP